MIKPKKKKTQPVFVGHQHLQQSREVVYHGLRPGPSQPAPVVVDPFVAETTESLTDYNDTCSSYDSGSSGGDCGGGSSD